VLSVQRARQTHGTRIPLTTLDLQRAVQLLSGIVDDVQGPITRGPGDLVRKREEENGERETDGEEHRFDEMPLPLGS
jgi:hypothetical protein